MSVTVHSADWVLTMTQPPLRGGEVAVDGDRIIAVGRALAGDRRRVWSGVLLPGLVNAHTHLEYGPSFADLAVGGVAFPAWIQALTARRSGRTDDDWLADARGSCQLLLTTGTTCVGDVVTIGPALAAVAEAGLAGVSYVEAAGVDEAGWPAHRTRIERMLNAHPTAGVSPHTLYSLDGVVFEAMVTQARRFGRRIHSHLAETVAEEEFVLAGSGPIAEVIGRSGLAIAGGHRVRPARRLDLLGGLGPDVHVAHGVHLDADDRALLRARGTAVALCSRSNAILQAGTAPVADYRAEGSLVAVGTDSLASTPDLDLLGELRALRVQAIDQGSPPAGLDEWLVAAATRGGAHALGCAEVGVLRPGARADLTVVQGAGADPYQQVVAGRAVATVLAGEVVCG